MSEEEELRGVVLPEPMLRYRCNQKGCCCSGWDIPFNADDLIRLHEHFDAEDRARLTRKVSLVVLQNGDQKTLQSIKLDGVGEDASCRFLSPDMRCGVQMKYGIEALPGLCVDFPVVPYIAKDGRVELYFEPICPEVLNQLGETDEPFRLVERQPPFDDMGFALRVRNATGPPKAQLGEAKLEAPALNHIRDAVVQAFADLSRPAWEHLSAVSWAFARLAAGAVPPESFAVRYDDDPQPFLAFLFRCVSAHAPELLWRTFERYKRFIWSIDRDDPRIALVPRYLAEWQPAFEKFLEPQEELLRALQLRYLAHRYFAPFLQVRGELQYAGSAVVHAFGMSLRYAAAFGAALERPVDKDIMKVALGCAEFFQRWLKAPLGSLPWFTPPGLNVPVPKGAE